MRALKEGGDVPYPTERNRGNRELGKKKKSSGGGSASGCNACRRRTQDSFVRDLNKDGTLLDAGRKLPQTDCKAELEVKLKQSCLLTEGVCFGDIEVEKVKEKDAKCEDKGSDDCSSAGYCCGADNCACAEVSESLCEENGCCISNAEPFDANICLGEGDCASIPDGCEADETTPSPPSRSKGSKAQSSKTSTKAPNSSTKSPKSSSKSKGRF
mmetsp:Transcript_61483/g.181704  ORF Transcript_61483/g.181704 Transcript_61483/m.181704 type:complete len:213 (-) Transcript_61483:321-959(-)